MFEKHNSIFKMGCSSSTSFAKLPNDQNRTKIKSAYPVIQVTVTSDNHVAISKDVNKLVNDSWSRLATNAQGNGLQVFLRIFETCPHTKKLFQVDNVRLSEIARNETIKRHGGKFMQAIGAAIDNIEGINSENSKLSKLLILLGRQHEQYEGFKVEYFEDFYGALMWQWERALGNEFTQEVADTWSRVFVYFMEKLKECYRHGG